MKDATESQTLSSDRGATTHHLVKLGSADLDITVVATKGCDIIEIVDRRTGIDVMAKSPWGLAPPGASPYLGSSTDLWLYHYGGGWQVLLPNGGDECTVDGATYGFHGEAALVPWSVDATLPHEASFHVDLYTAPIRINRTITVNGPQVTLRESAHNRSSSPIDVMWSHHPAFGAPLIEPGTRIETAAGTYWTDPVAPGSVGERGAAMSWPAVVASPAGPVDLSLIPARDQPRHTMGYLSNFDHHQVRVVNDTRDLAVTLAWDGDIFPHAWLWQELHSTAGYPWYAEQYTIAIEPATSIPGHGLANLKAHGGSPLTLAPHTTRQANIALTTSPALVAP